MTIIAQDHATPLAEYLTHQDRAESVTHALNRPQLAFLELALDTLEGRNQ